jgi:hypothetical protein
MTKRKNMRWKGHVAHKRAVRNPFDILVENTDWKRKLGGTRRRREKDVKWILIKLECVECICLS